MVDSSFDLEREAVARVVDAVRNSDQNDFRRQELAWLEQGSTVAYIAVNGYVEHEMRHDRVEQAEAGRQGALLGSRIVRELAPDYDAVAANHRRHFDGMRLAYPRELEDVDLKELLGETGEAVGVVRHPAARSLCAAFLTLSLTDTKPQLIKEFVAFPDKAVRERKRGRIQARAR